MTVLRVVVREGMSRDLAELFTDHLFESRSHFASFPPPAPKPHRHSKNRAC
jgi:hypothetical protein